MNHWQFSIDVGGTFTDCIGTAPDGRTIRHKLLSSGVGKGGVGEGSDRGRIVDPARRRDPEGFWTGYGLRLLDSGGKAVAESTVAEFEAGDFEAARTFYRRLIDEYPTDIRKYAAQQALRRMDETERALRAGEGVP